MMRVSSPEKAIPFPAGARIFPDVDVSPVAVTVPEDVSELSVPTLVTFGCDAVDSVPPNVVALTVPDTVSVVIAVPLPFCNVPVVGSEVVSEVVSKD
jgi:hypothetical protein